MVITLYADRRTPHIADTARQLAGAFARRFSPVALALPRGLAEDAPDGVAFVSLPEDGPAHEAAAALRAIAARHVITLVAYAGAPTEPLLGVCDASDRVLILADPSVAALRGAQRTLKLCASLGYGLEKVAVVLHGFADDAPVAPNEAAAALKREILWVLPGGGDPGQRARAFDGLASRLSPAP